MIALPIPWNKRKGSTLSFASTLYLYPILDLLLIHIPSQWHAELRLGLQEALVNAARHGNKLDPSKTIVVEFNVTPTEYCWIIRDEGTGFVPQCACRSEVENPTSFPVEEAENGRGLCILHEVFDLVHWNKEGTEVTLAKQVNNSARSQPAIL
ncbi:anti-sigma regulatory factor (Ser/Thr protein kinase) [Xenococcus sp. PCC 7305]|uniref:ATP-binding protein n=1 Tax=Xenococcus sp. PCC 7305 TaxID=102125 RepID=UPI0002ABF109|nr:anti-sigma regulatory factor [Xenococcus sp. PCC 7305]ELS03922.1 anti-sigma regulatory factor (Ser/Thr protein kinase) [Xenococcus sp. PCC 7305]